MGSGERTSGEKILHNSFWYGLETIIEAVVFLATSIAVARYLGPEKLGRFSYINFFILIVTRTGGSGLASATRKYMIEFLALDKPGTARAVYRMVYRYQLFGALALTATGLAVVLRFGDSGYRLMASLLVLSIIPGVMSWVPAQANQAFQDVSSNTISAFGYIVTNALILVLTIYFHWDLVGVASATLVGRTVEVVMRTIPLRRKMSKLPLETAPPDVVARIRRFCLEAMGVQLLMSVVWDRSEFFILKRYSTYEQIAFYSVSFSLSNNLLLIPRTFGSATSIALMSKAANMRDEIYGIMKAASRYLLFVVFPVHLGAAAITAQVIHVTYGEKYLAAIPVMMIAAILSIPRAFQELPEMLLRAADKQKRLLLWLAVAGVVNIALDLVLIPRFGAIGAAWGNGLAQSLGIVLVWQQARRLYSFELPLATTVRLLAAAGAMGAVAYGITRALPNTVGLVLAVAVAVPLYLLLVKLLRGLETSDRERLAPIGKRLPRAARRLYSATIAFVTPETT